MERKFYNSESGGGGKNNPAHEHARNAERAKELSTDERIAQLLPGASYIISTIMREPNSPRFPVINKLRDYVLSNNNPLIPKKMVDQLLKNLDQEEPEMIWAMAHVLFNEKDQLDKAA